MSFNPINWEDVPAEVLEAIENAKAEYGWSSVGIRIQEDIPFTVGTINHVSHVWDDGEDTGAELDGISALSAESIEMMCKYAGQYYGNHVAIIVGDIAECGEDACEIVLSNAEVVEVLA